MAADGPTQCRHFVFFCVCATPSISHFRFHLTLFVCLFVCLFVSGPLRHVERRPDGEAPAVGVALRLDAAPLRLPADVDVVVAVDVAVPRRPTVAGETRPTLDF